ncbi:type II secretion system protein M [Gilvimarinus agarilyticus]|uniref:type II secretion system protein GspM n=1 Tax=Gilvimarinus sp. 2_MG-2023 TaxID=3062666 RepID=UPI001C09DC76|nr:type II secretion system protein GspM [Gilvimarinus sp. 2_MG-2023]MBU2887575.1 type II secretion system protein M [Gilvimarinus agarilyticus]MDO6572226.1 type II secretion system protein GspM [Gilvimarinus sp. 2_MG-2023]
MANKLRFRKSSLMVLVSGAMLLVVMFWLLLTVFGYFVDYSRQVSDLKPKLARLQGLVSVEQTMLNAVSEVDYQLENLVLDADIESSRLGTQVQQKSRDIFRDTGMVVSGSQVAKPTETEQFLKIGVTLNIEGTLEDLELALLEVIHERPLMLIDEIEVTPERRHRNSREQKIGASIKLYSLQLRGDHE